jgi:hypothetical protein
MILALLLANVLNVLSNPGVVSNDARLLQVVSHIGSAEAQLAQTQGNGAVLAHLVTSSRMVDKCRFGLLGVNLENEGDAARTAWFEGLSDADRHAYVWGYCDRAVWALSDAKAEARKAGAKDARERWIKPALAEMALLDRGVKPNDLPDTVFGPHGHRGSYRALLAGLVYLRDHAESVMLQDYSHGFDTGWGQYGRIANAAHRTAGLWAGTVGEERGLVCRVLDGFALLWREVAEAFHQMMGYPKVTDAWLNFDRAAGRAVEMEQCR